MREQIRPPGGPHLDPPPERDGIVVRPLATDAERDAFFELAATTFADYLRTHCAQAPDGNVATGWRRFVEGRPGFSPSHVRGAFDGDQLLGGYLHEEHWLRVAGVRLCTGYVGAVVTAPAHRGRGVASALMRDALASARQAGRVMLILRGIAGFYQQFGYADVMEVTEHAVESAHVLALPEPDCRIRPATVEDAPALLALHERHYFDFTGSYSRALEQQEHFLRHRAAPPVLAVDAAGVPRGYLLLPCRADRSVAVEVAADTWPAALALLQHHASCARDATELRWPLPPGSVTYYHLADHLPVRSETRSLPNAGWMARPADLPGLFDGLVPLWRERWRRVRPEWRGLLVLDVEGERCCLELSDDLRRQEGSPDGGYVVRLSPQALVQLVFGYRPAWWFVDNAPAVLDVLFPTGTAWYPASNRC